MKRDARLHGFTSDHHHALVLARRLKELVRSGRAKEGRSALEAAFASELSPHFASEEETLLPPLAALEPSLVDRTLDDHRQMHALLLEATEAADPTTALDSFATLLESHVRFEESELFPACERLLDDEVLTRASKQRPHPQATSQSAPLPGDHR